MNYKMYSSVIGIQVYEHVLSPVCYYDIYLPIQVLRVFFM